MRDPVTAGVVSLFLPGLGQLLTGKPGRAVYFGLCALFMWTVTLGLFGWVINVLAALDAWYRALPEATEEPAVNLDPGSRKYVNPPSLSNVIPFPRPASSGQQEYL